MLSAGGGPLTDPAPRHAPEAFELGDRQAPHLLGIGCARCGQPTRMRLPRSVVRRVRAVHICRACDDALARLERVTL